MTETGKSLNEESILIIHHSLPSSNWSAREASVNVLNRLQSHQSSQHLCRVQSSGPHFRVKNVHKSFKTIVWIQLFNEIHIHTYSIYLQSTKRHGVQTRTGTLNFVFYSFFFWKFVRCQSCAFIQFLSGLLLFYHSFAMFCGVILTCASFFSLVVTCCYEFAERLMNKSERAPRTTENNREQPRTTGNTLVTHDFCSWIIFMIFIYHQHDFLLDHLLSLILFGFVDLLIFLNASKQTSTK